MKFNHNGKEFEIIRTETADEYHISVHQGGKQVGPTYGVSKEIENDYHAQSGKSMAGELIETAKSDVERGVYRN